MLSAPARAVITSLPPPPMMVSLPEPPLMMSLPLPPVRVLAMVEEPVMVLVPAYAVMETEARLRTY